MQSFAVFLNDLNDGRTLAGLTSDLQELLQTVQSTGRSGSITLRVKVLPGSKAGSEVDRVTIVADRKLELPKPEAPSDFFWLTDKGEPTRQHPRQQSLPLREVAETPTGTSPQLKEITQ